MTELTPEQLHIERLELRVALGGRSAERAQRELNELLKEDPDELHVVLAEEDRSV